jgi:hypothetical protein
MLRPKICAAACGGTRVSRYLQVTSRMRENVDPACIKLKFTTNRAAADWKIEIWLTRGSDLRHVPRPRPLRPFTCLVGNDDRSESRNPKPASEPLKRERPRIAGAVEESAGE